MIFYRAKILAWLIYDAAGFFEWLAARPWYMDILTDWVGKIPINARDDALELGCGPGLLTKKVHALGVEMTGLDRSQSMVEKARQNAPTCTFVEGDALDIPLDDNAVDIAFAASVVNVVPDAQKLVHEMTRVGRTGGRVSVLFPTPRLCEKAAEVIKKRNLTGLSAAALMTWGKKAPKREPEAIEALFEAAGLLNIRIDWFFENTVASVSGRVP